MGALSRDYSTCVCVVIILLNGMEPVHIILESGAYEPHGEKERQTSVPILSQITLQNAPYMDYNLLM